MKRIAILAFAAMAMAFFLPGSAHAQATRTWVSGVGDDANPCSRTAPCKTWAGAISKTSVGGEIDALDPGGFGGVTITNSITLDGGGGQVASVLVSGTNGITVAAGASAVVILRNLRINGLLNSGSPGTNGVSFTSGGALVIENVDIFGFGTWGINFTPSAASQLYVANTVLSNNGSGSTGGGILMAAQSGGTAKGVISNTTLLNNAVGFRADGEFTTNPTVVSLDNVVSSANGHAGATATTTAGGVLMMIDRLVANNANVGVQAIGSGSIIYLGNSVITGNLTGVRTQTSGQIVSYKNNEINGNTTTDGTPLTAVGAPGPLN